MPLEEIFSNMNTGNSSGIPINNITFKKCESLKEKIPEKTAKKRANKQKKVKNTVKENSKTNGAVPHIVNMKHNSKLKTDSDKINTGVKNSDQSADSLTNCTKTMTNISTVNGSEFKKPMPMVKPIILPKTDKTSISNGHENETVIATILCDQYSTTSEDTTDTNSVSSSIDSNIYSKMSELNEYDLDDEDGHVGFLSMSPVQRTNLPLKTVKREPIKFPVETINNSKTRKSRKKKSKSEKTETKKSTVSKKKSTEKPVQSHQLTEFYPVRRSSRKTKSEVKKEIEDTMIELIKSNCEEGLEVVEFRDKGRGVVARKEFKRSSFVVEYAGDLIDWKEAKKREQEYNTNPNIGCYMYYFNVDDVNYCIDATAESGRLGRLLNHSRKAPNCKTKLVKVQSDTGKIIPKLVLVAARDISVGEEMTYDYGDRDKASLETHPWLKS